MSEMPNKMNVRTAVIGCLRSVSAVKITAPIAEAAADLLEADAPEEREGKCFCEDECIRFGGWWVAHNGNRYTVPYCHFCGAHLGEDGIARRNADVRRMAAVMVALEELDGLPVPDMPAFSIDRKVFAVNRIREAIARANRELREGATPEAAIDAVPESDGERW